MSLKKQQEKRDFRRYYLMISKDISKKSVALAEVILVMLSSVINVVYHFTI